MLIGVQLAALLVAAIATVARFPVWALVDEAAHYDYVQSIAEEGRIPVLDEDRVHDEVLAIDEGAYPGAPARSRVRARAVRPLIRGLPAAARVSARDARLRRAERPRGEAARAARPRRRAARAVRPPHLAARPPGGGGRPACRVQRRAHVPALARRRRAGRDLLERGARAAGGRGAVARPLARADRALGALARGRRRLSGAALLTKLTLLAFLPALAVVCVAFLR